MKILFLVDNKIALNFFLYSRKIAEDFLDISFPFLDF